MSSVEATIPDGAFAVESAAEGLRVVELGLVVRFLWEMKVNFVIPYETKFEYPDLNIDRQIGEFDALGRTTLRVPLSICNPFNVVASHILGTVSSIEVL